MTVTIPALAATLASNVKVGGIDVLSLLLAAVVATALFVAVLSISGGRDDIDEVAKRLERYADPLASRGAPAAKRGGSPKELFQAFSEFLNQLLSQSSRAGKLAEDLARADLKLKSSEWLLALVGAGTLLGLLAVARFGTVLAFIPGPVIAYFVGGMVLRFLQSRRRRSFDRQLGETIILLSNALKAGYSFAQAIATVGKTATPPISEEFNRATREMALGINVDEALQHMVRRNDSEDFDLMVTAVQIHRVVGGNLAEILDTIAFTIRERVRIKGEIRTLTAQARASGYIITGLPIFLAAMLTLIAPDYFNPMFHEKLGIIMLMICGFSMLIGFAIIRKIVDIEV